ncbi:MAG: hypothetical protein AB9873_03665 [Syntrophobacteraceae bacterium]
MAHYTMIEEGSYPTEAAFLYTADNNAVSLEDGLIEVYLNGDNERRLRGSGRAYNRLIIELLEDHDDMNLLLDLGDSFRYVLDAPVIRAGRSLDAMGLIHFTAENPIRKLDGKAFEELRSGLHVLEG